MREFLLEILSEDIPARMQVQAAEDLKTRVLEWLKGEGLSHSNAFAYSTPRRLALVIGGLAESSPDRTDERKGPKVGAPENAIQGFLKSADLASIDEAEVRSTDKGEVYFAVRKVPGKSANQILSEAVYVAIIGLSWPKSMRWSQGNFRWVRPIQRISMVFDGAPITSVKNGLPVARKITLGNNEPLLVGNETVGHRFLAPKSFTFSDFADYERKLLEHHVVLDREKRKWRIKGDAKRLTEAHGLVVVHDEALLDEVAGLVEWPVVLMGSIDDQFMDLPPEVRRTTMRANQKYFTLETAEGKPANRFLIVANMETEDHGAAIIAGNERVLRARLSDARFFYDQDRKTKLADQRPKLAKIAFHAKLGSVLERVERLERLAGVIAEYVPGAEMTMAVEAAALCKSDLVSGMVGEFPELQGLMGGYYALAENAPRHVADAIRDHYKPLGPGDICPSEPVSVVLALAEKIDTLVCFFAIGELPTGSKDPFALRRAALGIIRLIVENRLRLPLNDLVKRHRYSVFNTISAIEQNSRLPTDIEFQTGENFSKLVPFFADRLKVVLKERGVRHDLVDAVFALGGEDDLVRLLSRVQALQDFLATDDGANLLTAYRRAANILRIEEKKDNVSYDGEIDLDLLEDPKEIVLADAMDKARDWVEPLIDAEDFHGAMSLYVKLRHVIDAFFDAVTVNADQPEIRANRLRLLSRIRGTLNKIADFSRIG